LALACGAPRPHAPGTATRDAAASPGVPRGTALAQSYGQSRWPAPGVPGLLSTVASQRPTDQTYAGSLRLTPWTAPCRKEVFQSASFGPHGRTVDIDRGFWRCRCGSSVVMHAALHP